MTENEINKILNGFTGEFEHDVAYFLSISEEYDNDPDFYKLYNAALNKSLESFPPEIKIKFFEKLKAAGMGHLVKQKPAELHSLSSEDIVMVKKAILGKLSTANQISIDCDEAILVGQPLTLSVPKEVVEQLKKKRKEWQDQHDKSKRKD